MGYERVERRYPFWFGQAISAGLRSTNADTVARYQHTRISDPLTRLGCDSTTDADRGPDADDNEDTELRAGGSDQGSTVSGKASPERGHAGADVNVPG